jgi:hypothetical protein
MVHLVRCRLASTGLSATVLICAATLAAFSTSAETQSPIRLAVFDFELEDFSAAAGASGESQDDRAQLIKATAEASHLLVQSGRYRLVDTAGTDAEAVKTHSLRSCGCDAAIALKLGADQSLVGVITRISRTEYTVQVQIRDAQTGSVVFKKLSDLRMGANYSWSRGASSLIKLDLLARTD